MRKDKLKINFQRIFSLFCVSLIFFFGVLGLFPFSVSASSLSQDALMSVLVDDGLEPPSDLIVYTGSFYFGREVGSLLVISPRSFSAEGSSLDGIYFGGGLDDLTQIFDWDTGLTLDSYGCFAFSHLVLAVGSNYPLFDSPFNFGLVGSFKDDLNLSIGTYRFGNFRIASDPSLQSYVSVSVPLFGTMRYNTDLAGSDFVVAYFGDWQIARSFYSDDGIAPYDMDSYQFLLDNLEPPPSFLDRVTSGLTSVIAWVGAVVSAVISGPLSPLLGFVAVGIAVSAILLVIYLVRRFIWGA